jgi:hypothetical protein
VMRLHDHLRFARGEPQCLLRQDLFNTLFFL